MQKILLVDDDKLTLDVVTHILTERGFHVKAYSSGLDVPEVVKSYDPNLVLLDIRLPGKFGTDICAELKQAHQNLPVILFSTYAADGIDYERYSAVAFISKPFDVADLLAAVDLYI